MRVGTAMMVAALVPLALAGCGNGKKAQARADARAAGFVPPSVLSRLDYGGIVERRFRALDRNGDGRISATEWSEGMLARFDRMDGNHDGSVTSTERETEHKR